MRLPNKILFFPVNNMKSVTHAPSTKKSAIVTKRAKTARVHGSRGLHDTILEVYTGINGFNTYTIGATQDKSTYGEVTPQGIKILYDKFKQFAPLQKVSATRRRFYDLGSGVGKVIVGMAVLNSEVECYGIENMPERARLASMAYSKIKSPQIQRRVHFSTDSILNPAVPIRDATWIFISNLCFDADTQDALANRLQAEVQPGSIVICSRQLSFASTVFETLDKSCTIPMSWSNTSSCWIYRRV
jgi:hypothetical protein